MHHANPKLGKRSIERWHCCTRLPERCSSMCHRDTPIYRNINGTNGLGAAMRSHVQIKKLVKIRSSERDVTVQVGPGPPAFAARAVKAHPRAAGRPDGRNDSKKICGSIWTE